MGELKIQCPATHELVSKLDKAQALRAGYASLRLYKAKHHIEYTTVEQRSFQKMKKLYNVDFRRWVVGYETPKGMVYATKKYGGRGKSACDFPLGPTQFNEHFSGKHPLAIFAHGKESKFFAMDVDTKEHARNDTYLIVETLISAGISRQHIHVNFSGSKGYHVTLFSDKALPFETWHKLGDYVRYKCEFSGNDVEYRPNETNGHALKLPLTLHPKTKAFAGYCNEFLTVLDEQASHDYLNAIEPMDSEELIELIGELDEFERQESPKDAVEVVDNRLFQTSEEKTDSAIKLLTDGLAAPGTRWKAIRNTLIPYIKCEMGCDAEETRDILYGFCEREYEKGRSTTGKEQYEREIDDLIENFYPLVTGIYSVQRDIVISREEVEWVVSVIENGGSRASRDLLWALLLMRKTYGGKDGRFFASRETIQKLLSKPRTISPATIQKSRDWLADSGYITYKVPDDSFSKRRATSYTVEFNEPEEVTILKKMTFEQESDARNLLSLIADSLYSKTDVRRLKLRN